MKFNKPGLLTIICVLVIILVSAFIAFSDRASISTYQTVIIFTSWFADIATLIHFLNRDEYENIFNKDFILSYSLGLTLIKTLLGIGNLYLIYLDSIYKKWWAKAGTIVGSLIWLLVGFASYTFTTI